MSLVAVNVNTGADLSAGAGTHTLLPPAGPTSIVPSLETTVPHEWPPGVAAGQCKLTSTVRHGGRAIVLDGHDCGTLIPQITTPPSNALLPIHMLFSSRQTSFATGTVTMNGQPVACASILPPLPLTACGDPISTSLVSVTPGHLLRSVRVGMGMADLVRGVTKMACRLFLELLLALGRGELRRVGPVHDPIPLSNAYQVMATAVERMLPVKLGERAGRHTAMTLAKAGLAAASGFAIDKLAGYDRPTASVGVGLPGAGIGVEYSEEQGASVTATTADPATGMEAAASVLEDAGIPTGDMVRL